MPPNAEKVLETSAVILLIVLSSYAYVTLLGGLPYDLLMDMCQLSKRNFEALKYAWVSEGLGKPNDKLAFTVIYALPAFLNLLGASLNTICLMLLSILWILGGGSMYLLAKRLSRSSLTGLTSMFIYLGATAALRGLWCGLDVSALYVLTPLVLLTVDWAYERRNVSYGFYTALASTLLSGALAKLNNLAVLALTVLAYFTVKTRGRTVDLKWVAMFLTVAGASWLMMNIWWIAIPPGLSVKDFNPLCLIVFPITALTFLTSIKIEKMNTVQALMAMASVILLMDPREAVSSNLTPEVLAVVSTAISIMTTIGFKRFAEKLGDYISISLVVEGNGVKEYDLVKPFTFLAVIGIVVYQGLTVPLSWSSGLNIPDYYMELKRLTDGDHRVLTMPVTEGGVYYIWSDREYEEPVEDLILDKPIVHDQEFTVLNNLTGKTGFWKILAALNVRFIILHHDIDLEKTSTLNPWLIEKKFNYSFIVSPSLANGVINISSETVKPLLEDLGFIHLINFNPYTHYEVGARYVDIEEGQSKIHLYACGEAWISEQTHLNQTFSFAYTLPTISNWLDYNYLEFWIKVNGSDKATIQLYDVYGKWALWNLDLREHIWNMAVIPLNDAILDTGLDRSKVVMVVFSMNAPMDRQVEVEGGGIFLDRGILTESKPLEIVGKYYGKLTLYRLRDGLETRKVYVAERVLKIGENLFEELLRDEFNPKSSVYVDGEVLEVSHAEVEYVEVGSTLYRVTVSGFQRRFLLVLNERHDPGWTIYIGRPNPIDMLIKAEPRNVRHVKVNGLFNGWYVESEDVDRLTITIVYKPQLLLDAFRTVSTVVIVLSLILLLLKRRFNKMLKHIRIYLGKI